jgi:hypothetical protein
MRIHAAGILTIVLLASSLLACGGDDGQRATERDVPPDGSSTPTDSATVVRSEDELAETLLLDVNDFPLGWSETAESESDDEEDGPCDDELESEIEGGDSSGSARSGDFSEGNVASVTQWLATFDSAGDARTRLSLVEEFGRCLVDAFNDGEADTSEAGYSDASLGEVSFPALGDSSVVFRIQVTGRVLGESGPFSEVEVYADLIAVQTERVAFVMLASDVLSPFDPDLLLEIAQTATAKVNEGLR